MLCNAGLFIYGGCRGGIVIPWINFLPFLTNHPTFPGQEFLPLFDSHKSKSIDYTQVELWELELMQTALWFIYAHFLIMHIQDDIPEVGRGLNTHTMLDQLVSELREKMY